jgi:phosphoribosylaminoimidazolecarboxamide formyltransferase/IMP cyclohydrolase
LHTLTDAGVTATGISEYTGVREMLDGRVKSLHPKVHAGLLGIREKKVHQEEMMSSGYPWIDLVVVNFQPLDALMRDPNVSLDEVMEHIDIGGNAMIRSAAKNFRYVSVIVHPENYTKVIHEMKAHDGVIPFAMRYTLAQEAFAYTAKYNQDIANYLLSSAPPAP